jgi:2-deoxy-D-gluconate 3-dehydrogenase
MFDLTGRVALITGGNGGIGLAMAKGLAEANARVILAGRDPAKGSAAVALIGENAVFLTADITNPDAIQRLIEESEAIEGRLDILVNNAGTSIRRQPEELSLADWHMVLNTNLTSIFLCCQAVLPAMQRAGGGKIINIGSMLSIFGTSFGAAYAASKGGVVQLTRSLATAWAKDGIQVNAVLPGWVETALTDRARTEVDGLYERVLSRTPAGRWGRPEDLAGIAVFLASAASDFVTGTAIPVDGGFSVQG